RTSSSATPSLSDHRTGLTGRPRGPAVKCQPGRLLADVSKAQDAANKIPFKHRACRARGAVTARTAGGGYLAVAYINHTARRRAAGRNPAARARLQGRRRERAGSATIRLPG